MQALVGVELLLDKAQIWEVGAARHVSLSPELAELSRLVARWRKLELASWPALLDTAKRQHEESADQVREITLDCPPVQIQCICLNLGLNLNRTLIWI